MGLQTLVVKGGAEWAQACSRFSSGPRSALDALARVKPNKACQGFPRKSDARRMFTHLGEIILQALSHTGCVMTRQDLAQALPRSSFSIAWQSHLAPCPWAFHRPRRRHFYARHRLVLGKTHEANMKKVRRTGVHAAV